MKTKKIKSLYVIRPGSNPDIDSDFNTQARNHAIEHVREIYGADNVAAIGTFSTLAAKGAFKTMCTIYEVPFAQANKIADLIPPDIEGVGCTIEDIFNPKSDRYSDAVDFRNATSGDEWKKIIAGARAIEGRNKTTSVHPCGIVISSKPLINTVPLQVRQDDGLVVTQWSYEELESLGLIKMDFLGLDTVDLIQHTVENIIKNGKPALNMLDIINGPMDDKKTFEMLSKGETIGVFQLASPGVQDLLKRIKPTGVEDIIASTALYRPGPMGMQSHIKYADRKNGREPMDYIHDEFKNSPLVDILAPTQGLVVYQEQVMQLAHQIAGFSLKEADDLRKAMGKKIIEKMLEMKPKFMDGGKERGYSQSALQLLWDTIAEFAKYGFNRAHSVAYGINAYQAAYLKANYPVEFMAALISQNIGNRDKISSFLQESRRMGLKIGSIDVNTSDVRVAPDFTGNSEFDIVFGLSGANAVSEETAEIIVKEREANGLFASAQDFVTRCYSKGVTNRRIYENIAKAGGFDSFEVSRRGVVENLPGLLEAAKTKGSRGNDLFDLFGGGASIEASSIDLNSTPEYPHIDKLKMEAEVIGLYLTGHPLSNVGPGLSKARTATVKSLMKSSSQVTVKLTGALTEITKKIMRKGGKSMTVILDDGTGYIQANLSRDIVKGLDKKTAQARIQKLYENGEIDVPDELAEIATSDEFFAIDELEKNSVYSVSLTFRPARGESPYGARINAIEKLTLSDDGSLPIRMRFLYDENNEDRARKLARSLPKAIAARNPGDYSIIVALEPKAKAVEDENKIYQAAINEMRNSKRAVAQASANAKTTGLWGGAKEIKGKAAQKENSRNWPPIEVSNNAKKATAELSESRIRLVSYEDVNLKAAKTKRTELDIEKYLGVESYDFGVFDPSVLED